MCCRFKSGLLIFQHIRNMASLIFEPVYLAGQFYNSPQEVQDTYQNYAPLILKYFKKGWNRGGVENINIPNKKDRATLIQMCTERMAELSKANSLGSSIYTRGTIANSRTQKVVQELESIKNALTFYGKKASGEDISNAQKTAELKEIAEISAERPYEILFEHAWNLLHPANIDDDVRQAWLKLLRHSRDNPVDILLEHIKEAKDGKPGLNYLKNTNIIKQIKKEGATLESAAAATYKEFKESAAKIKKQADLQKRLHQVFNILKTMALISGEKQKEANTVVNDDDDDSLGRVIETLPGEMASKMTESLKPVYSYYEKQYKEPYKSVEEFVNKYKDRSTKDFPIDTVLNLMSISQKWQDKHDGTAPAIVKITEGSVTSEAVTALLGEYQTYMKSKGITNAFEPKEAPDEGRSDTTNIIYTALSSGIRAGDSVVVQFVTDILAKEADVTTAVNAMMTAKTPKQPADAPKVPEIIKSVTNYFSDKSVFMVVQTIPEKPEDMKELPELATQLYTTGANEPKSYNTLYGQVPEADRKSFADFGVAVVALKPLVNTLTQRLLSLMSVLYFKKMLEESVKKATEKAAAK